MFSSLTTKVALIRRLVDTLLCSPISVMCCSTEKWLICRKAWNCNCMHPYMDGVSLHTWSFILVFFLSAQCYHLVHKDGRDFALSLDQQELQQYCMVDTGKYFTGWSATVVTGCSIAGASSVACRKFWMVAGFTHTASSVASFTHTASSVNRILSGRDAHHLCASSPEGMKLLPLIKLSKGIQDSYRLLIVWGMQVSIAILSASDAVVP